MSRYSVRWVRSSHQFFVMSHEELESNNQQHHFCTGEIRQSATNAAVKLHLNEQKKNTAPVNTPAAIMSKGRVCLYVVVPYPVS
jgi:hypothetical protein